MYMHTYIHMSIIHTYTLVYHCKYFCYQIENSIIIELLNIENVLN